MYDMTTRKTDFPQSSVKFFVLLQRIKSYYGNGMQERKKNRTSYSFHIWLPNYTEEPKKNMKITTTNETKKQIFVHYWFFDCRIFLPINYMKLDYYYSIAQYSNENREEKKTAHIIQYNKLLNISIQLFLLLLLLFLNHMHIIYLLSTLSIHWSSIITHQ